MAISNHIEKFDDLRMKMADAIFYNNQKAIERLDVEIAAVFDAIMICDDVKPEEMELFVSFLLRCLIPKENRSTLDSKICEKIIQIATS